MIRWIALFIVLPYLASTQPTQRDVMAVMTKINYLRASGCTCGGQQMHPVGPVKWDDRLYRVSRQYAIYMNRHNHFEHLSREGEDLGDRLDALGYPWLKIGENLAFGYRDFHDVLEAWKESPSHCRMLMDPEVTHMGLSKKGLYWAQSFSLPDLGVVSE
ncbi:MAG: CAP domain-containing protein [Bacteroidota bacterium]